MNVLFITRSLQSGPGGMQTATRLLLDELKMRKDVELTVLGWGGGKIGLFFFFIRALLRARRFRGDAVHFGDAAFSVIIPNLRRRRPDLRLTCTVHGLDLTFGRPSYQAALRKALPLFDALAAVSSATAEAAVARGARPDRVTVIPWGVPLASLAQRAEGPPALLTLGRQIPRKGTAWFVEHVMPELVRVKPSLQLIVAGEGPETERIWMTASALWLDKNVRMAGRVDEFEKNRLYEQADLFVMPNVETEGDMEGFGMTCIEAAARGIPVVAARLEGIPDAIREGETGLLFTPGDAADAAAVILHALDTRWGRLSVQRCCRRHYDIGTVASRYVTELFAPAGHRHPDGR